jgi:hypothetical protein
MKVLGTLLWLEFKKSYPLLLGTLLFFAILAPGIANIPEYGAMPSEPGAGAGAPEECEGEACEEDASESWWSFDYSWSSGTADEEDEASSQSGTSTPSMATGQLVQAFRGRQLAVLFTAGLLSAILLLAFFFTHYRESDSGEIALLYQTPVSADLHLWVRFGFMILCVGLINDIVLGYYWVLQRWQGLEFFGPVAAGLGHSYQLDWINITLIGILLFAFPIAAFILLFCQVQNAYGLLNRRRLAGLVLVIASLQSIALSMGWVYERWSQTQIWIRIVQATNESLTAQYLSPADPENFLFRVPIEVLSVSLVATVVMLILSGRIWNEVEWS